jgi:hypothetical protein
MIRGCLVGMLSLALAGCSLGAGNAANDPSWLKDGIADADAHAPGYPDASNIPNPVPVGTVRREWAAGVTAMVALRESVLSDPSLIDPDAEDASDAVGFATRSREQVDRDVERLSDEALE